MIREYPRIVYGPTGPEIGFVSFGVLCVRYPWVRQPKIRGSPCIKLHKHLQEAYPSLCKPLTTKKPLTMSSVTHATGKSAANPPRRALANPPVLGYAITDQKKYLDFELKKYELEPLKDDRVTVAVEVCGVCGSVRPLSLRVVRQRLELSGTTDTGCRTTTRSPEAGGLG